MNLTLRQIAAFREVMLCSSISQAAKTLSRTQPAVSTMINTLETELGFKLFVREHSKLTPTAEAFFFLHECEAILSRLERTKKTLQSVKTLEAGKLSVACQPAAASHFLPSILTDFLKDKPKVNFVLNMRSSEVVQDLIASQQYDIGFAETPKPIQSIKQIDYDLECVCILPAKDALASLDVITAKDLNKKPMAILFEEHTTAIQTKKAFLSCNSKLSKRLELRTFFPGLQFVAAGLCYMICDMVTAYSYLLQEKTIPNLTMRRFTPRISNSVSILTPAYTTPTLISQSFALELAKAIELMQKRVSEQCS